MPQIEITQADIDKANEVHDEAFRSANVQSCCPIAQALKRVYQTNCANAGYEFWTTLKENASGIMSAAAKEFMHQWDNDQPVEPCTLDLPTYQEQAERDGLSTHA